MTLATVGLSRAQMRERLDNYRTRHTIRPVPAFTGGEVICEVDGIRVLLKRGNVGHSPWRHDPDEIKALTEGLQRSTT